MSTPKVVDPEQTAPTLLELVERLRLMAAWHTPGGPTPKEKNPDKVKLANDCIAALAPSAAPEQTAREALKRILSLPKAFDIYEAKAIARAALATLSQAPPNQSLDSSVAERARESLPKGPGRVSPVVRSPVEGPSQAPEASVVPSEPIEIRLNDDGTLDEVVGGRGIHLEQMSPTHWWMAVYEGSGEARVTVNFHARGKISANVEREGAPAAHPRPTEPQK